MLTAKHKLSAMHCQVFIDLCTTTGLTSDIGMAKKEERLEKDAHAVHLGRRGGLARMQKLTPE